MTDQRPEPRPEPAPVLPGHRAIRRDGGLSGAAITGLTAAAVAGLIVATFAGRELSAPPAWLTVIVLFLPYCYGAAAVWCFALWSVVPDRRLPPMLMATLVVLGVGRWGPGCSPGAPVRDGRPISVMSWNVRRLWGGDGDGGDPAACVQREISTADPDVVTLLEVSASDVDRLAKPLGLECAHAPYFIGRDANTSGAAVCVRQGRASLRSGTAQRFVDQQDWSYLFAEIEREGAVFNVLAVHLAPYRVTERDLRRSFADLWSGHAAGMLELGDRGERIIRAQADQSAALVDRVVRLRDPTVIAGDFNSTRDTALHVALRRTLTDTYERAGRGFGGTIRVLGELPLRVDFIYASTQFGVSDSEIPAVDCSDHRPVVSHLVLPP